MPHLSQIVRLEPEKGQYEVLALNVSTLSKKLDTILSWQADVYGISEVRLSLSLCPEISRTPGLGTRFLLPLLPASPSLGRLRGPPGGVWGWW